MIEMHDLIQDMGRYVVRMQKDSGEQSRLWDVEDIEKVMVNNTVGSLNNAILFNFYSSSFTFYLKDENSWYYLNYNFVLSQHE
uniref:Putative ovule protein n=1 Tax=Solanum chacoense TaxID=4108 RepID=A0A0V0GGI4_SOLCH